MIITLIILLATAFILYRKSEKFTILPQPTQCSRSLDALPKHGVMSPSGSIKWVSNRPPQGSHCQKVICHPPLQDVTCWYCPRKPHTIEPLQNTQKYYAADVDRRANAVRHLVIDQFDRIQRYLTVPPLPTPGYRCAQRVCPPEYNIDKTCWNCEIPK